jgi:hypothetical protein
MVSLAEKSTSGLAAIPRRMVALALTSLALSPGSFEEALSVFWLAELRTPHRIDSECLDALIVGALASEGYRARSELSARESSVWRALGIFEAVVGDARGSAESSRSKSKLLTVYPTTRVVNTLLQAAFAATHTATQLRRCKAAIGTLPNRTKPSASVSLALLDAARRLGDVPSQLEAVRMLRRRGRRL